MIAVPAGPSRPDPVIEPYTISAVIGLHLYRMA